MKIIKIIFFSFLALSLIVGGGIFIFFETFDADQYLPQITRKASLALGRPVFIGHVGLGLSWAGITLDAGPVIIAGDSGLITQPFVKIDRARIILDARSFIRFIHQRNLEGSSGEVIVTNGAIKNFNIIKAVLSYMPASIGGMDDYIDKLGMGANDTMIKRTEVKFSLHNKAVFIDDSLIQTNIFELSAKGSVDQGLNTDMQTMLHLNSDISGALVNKLEGLKYLMDDSKRITIEASLKGVIPHLKYKPSKDFRKKSKKFLMEEGGNILNALLR